MAGSVPKDLGNRVRNLNSRIRIFRRNESRGSWLFNGGFTSFRGCPWNFIL